MRPPASSDELDPLTTRTLERMVRDHPWTGDWHRIRAQSERSHRRRRRLPLLISSVAAAALIVLVVALSLQTDTRRAADEQWSDPINGIGITVEPPFRRASLALAPASREILTLSTGPLLIGAPTDRWPLRAAQAVGDNGMLITIHELELPEDLPSNDRDVTPAIGYQERPASFDLASQPTGQDGRVGWDAMITVTPGMRRWIISFTDHDRRLTAIVLAGGSVTEAQLEQATRVLDSLQVRARPMADPLPLTIAANRGTGRVRYIGTAAGFRVYVRIADDGEVCVVLDGLGTSCSQRAILDGRGIAAMHRAANGQWFGAIVPPTGGAVTVNEVPVGDGPQPILVNGVDGEYPVVRQGDVTIPVIP